MDVTHSTLVAFSRVEGRLSGFVYGNIIEMVAWILGLAAAVLLVRRSTAGPYLAGTAGFVIAMVGGFGDLGVLYRASAPIAGPMDLARTLTTITIGIGFGLLGATALVSRRRGSRKRTDPGQNGPDRADLKQTDPQRNGRQRNGMLPAQRDMAS